MVLLNPFKKNLSCQSYLKGSCRLKFKVLCMVQHSFNYNLSLDSCKNHVFLQRFKCFDRCSDLSYLRSHTEFALRLYVLDQGVEGPLGELGQVVLGSGM